MGPPFSAQTQLIHAPFTQLCCFSPFDATVQSIVGDTLEKFKDVIKFLLKRHERAMAIIAEE